ncbi:alpha/beta hydrolase [Caulobacter sp. 17J65-9]|uniref:alpha/beta hydrolase n=1 Tax=Caulobacter sp. 17J65-9 TaxID=2709382 RepID=UPI0013C59EF2|nr:alpha/beta hydrolase [Caulobacter sp. 17J65-9]NEX95177.1 alpha/beta hydrolase [Caulobacter sp. 17J65-9]
MTGLLIRGLREAAERLLSDQDWHAPPLGEVRELAPPGPGGPLRARLYAPVNAPAHGPALLYFHGGGFVCGSIDTHDSVCRWLAASSGVRFISCGYRLAPETAFPGQQADALAAARWVREEAGALGVDPERLALGGDSAGAYLAALTALTLNAERPGSVPLQLLLYPLLHLEDAVWREEVLRHFRVIGRVAAQSIRREIGDAPFPSLLEAPLDHAPPTLLAGGGPLDPVRADVEAYGQRLAGAGRLVFERTWPALVHGGLNLTHLSKGSVSALTEVGTLLGKEMK